MSLHYLIGFASIFPIKADRLDGIDALSDRLMPVMVRSKITSAPSLTSPPTITDPSTTVDLARPIDIVNGQPAGVDRLTKGCCENENARRAFESCARTT